MDLGRAAIAAVERLIRPHVRRTPVLELDATEFGLPPARLNFKLELLQHAGSFKARGAFANLLTRDVPRAGVVAASGGNHGAAVAYAARKLGVPARIYVPTVSSPAKLALIRSYGAELVVQGERYADALAAAEQWADSSGAMKIHAYDEPGAILGQGSVALEWEHQAPELDTVLVAVGGGGLIGGIAAWYERKTRIIGVEPEAAPTLTRALEAGKPVDAPAGGIAADSLAPRRVGELMFPLAQKHVARVVLVKDEAIRSAQQMLWDRLRIVAEPGGAAAFAALLSEKYRPAPDERVGILVCGGNTSAVAFST
ncbi:MAG TPA: threonine/serine dehydratase [Burkholderiales bacterium]|nr:threonine/serine dehydratase [Burkholderiales bacterium]